MSDLPQDTARAVRNGVESAAEARQKYRDECAAKGREIDPVMDDIVYHRELARAEGRIYFAGD